MGKVVLIAALLALAALAAYAPAPAYAAASIEWHDFEGAMNISLEQGKPAMVDFYTDWCSWCKELDNKTYPDARMIELSGQFSCAKVNAEARTDLASRYKIESYPTVVFLNPDGTERYRVVGYKGPDDFLKDMNYALGLGPKPVESDSPSPNNLLPLLLLPVIIAAMAILAYDLYIQKKHGKGDRGLAPNDSHDPKGRKKDKNGNGAGRRTRH